jgi:hypothetical protein
VKYQHEVIYKDIILTGTDNNTTQSESNDALYTPDFQSGMENTTSDTSRENDAPINKSLAQNKHFKSLLKGGKKIINYNYKFLETESKKLSYFEKGSHLKQDNDYQFLISLLPSLQGVPEETKLRVRMKLMDVLLQEQEDRNSSVMSTSNVSPLYCESTHSSHNSSHSNELVTDQNNAPVYYGNFDPL